jgi:chitinase
MRAHVVLLLLGLPVLHSTAHAESAITTQDASLLHTVALSTYSQDASTPDLADAVSPEVLLGTTHTTSSSNVSDSVGQQIEQEIRRTLRQRHPHAQFCADTAGLNMASKEVVVQLRIDAEGSRTVSSDAHPQFAQCMTRLVQHWPLPDLAQDSRTRVAYRAVAPTNEP